MTHNRLPSTPGIQSFRDQPATKGDLHEVEMAIQQLRVIVHHLMDPEIAARFSDEWFGPKSQ